MNGLDGGAVDYYERAQEDDRLSAGTGLLEFERSKRIVAGLLSRVFPDRLLRILDAGGGTGPYAFWLAGLGHEVHLLDLAPKHVQIATGRNDRAATPLASIGLGDARQLRFPDAAFDAVLLFGPLYHLQERGERLAALAEARRVLRHGGLLLAAFIGRFASMLDGFHSGFIDDPEFRQIMKEDLATGKHRPSSADPLKYFTNAYLHHPRQMTEEVVAAGYAIVDQLAVEGFGWVLPDLAGRWADPARREVLLEMLEAVERDPSLMGMSAHVIVVGRKD